MDVRYCMVCDKEIVKVCLDEYVYKKQCSNRVFYACSWSCYNKMRIPSKKEIRAQRLIEKELNGELKISDDYATLHVMTHEELRQEAKESKEIAEKRREIERGLKKRNKHIVYWHRDNSTHNNSKTT